MIIRKILSHQSIRFDVNQMTVCLIAGGKDGICVKQILFDVLVSYKNVQNNSKIRMPNNE